MRPAGGAGKRHSTVWAQLVDVPSITVPLSPLPRGLQSRAMAEPSSGAPAATSPDDRLDSWKEIAAFLKRDVTTVQRWERREGMPVRRHVHDKMGSVYAFRSELEAWSHRRDVPVVRDNNGGEP